MRVLAARKRERWSGMQMRQTQKGRESRQRVANWIRGRGARHRRVNRGKDADQTRRLRPSFAAAAAAAAAGKTGKTAEGRLMRIGGGS